ncbi:MAG: T9SS type A sorting domain-containing protein [Bacteroidetes bacterium]|nr:T9SS type A sorting domain-containing protein [Bacteroidota bacterium]
MPAGSEMLVTVSDVLGKTILTKSITDFNNTLDVNALNQGIYFRNFLWE